MTDNPGSRVRIMKRILRDIADLYLITELELKTIQNDFIKIKKRVREIDTERSITTRRIEKEINGCLEGIEAEFRDDTNKLEKNGKKFYHNL